MPHTDPSKDRERDALGRPLNARPRDGLGRPLARDAEGVTRTPEGQALAPDEAIAEAQRLLDAGMPFHAHEVLEETWKVAPPEERELWQGLAQLAVGLTHAMRGNTNGSQALLVRGTDRLRAYELAPPHELNIAGLIAWSEAAVDRLQSMSQTSRSGPEPHLDLKMPALHR